MQSLNKLIERQTPRQMSLNSTCIQLHFRDHAEQNRRKLLFQNRSRTTRRCYYMREKSKHQNFSMASLEKRSLLWTYMYLDKTRQHACNNRRTLCLANCDICNGSPVTEWVRSLIPTLLIIRSPPLWPLWVRAPHWSHVGQAKFCLRVCQVVFLGYYLFAPPTDWLVSI